MNRKELIFIYSMHTVHSQHSYMSTHTICTHTRGMKVLIPTWMMCIHILEYSYSHTRESTHMNEKVFILIFSMCNMC